MCTSEIKTTQGVVSVKKGERVVMKFIARCNGENGRELAHGLRQNPVTTLEQGHQVASKVRFGCPVCLVVMDGTRMLAPNSELMYPFYRSMFERPRVNPQMDRSPTDHIEVVEL